MRGWFVFVVQLPHGVDRDATVRALAERGIQSKPYLPAIHLMSFYRERFGHREGEFPVCEDVAARSIALPFFPAMTEGQVARVAEDAARRSSAAEPVTPPPHVPLQRAAAPRLPQLNASIGFDWRLGPYDVDLSRAHARMLAAQGIVAADDRDELLAALDTVEHELEEGTFPFLPDDEDIHMAIERRVTELAGPVGGKLHTARSRNDQVATDMALFTRAHAQAAAAGVRELMARARRGRRAPSRLARCPATRTSSARSRSTSATTCSRTCGCSRATASASPPSRRRPRSCRSARARSRA